MLKKGKRIVALALSLLLLLSSVTAFAADAPESQEAGGYVLTVNVTGNGNVEVTGEGVTGTGEHLYSVLPGTMVAVKAVPGEGMELSGMTLDGVVQPESFLMPEQDAVLEVTFTAVPQPEVMEEDDHPVEVIEANPELQTDGEVTDRAEQSELPQVSEEPAESVASEYVTNSKGIQVKKSLLCDDPDCLETHVGITLIPDQTASLFNAKRQAVSKLVDDPYVGMVLSGSNASVRFLGVPGTNGDFSVSINDGLLSGVTGTGWCLNHGAANPGENGTTTCTWEATCTEINGDMATWSFVVTPPGACEPGSVLGYQRVGLTEQVQFESKGHLDVYKTSRMPEITDGNSCYSLAGAVYGLYQSGVQIKTATTDSTGYARFADIKKGDYILKEITPPKGYALDLTEYPVTINSKQTTRVDVKDNPQSDPVTVLLGKVDRETTQNMPQGSASLEGAEFTFKYYDVISNTDPAESGKQPVRTWVMRTDERGFTRLAEKYKVSGDNFYKINGVVTLPLGTLTIQETKAPEGYLLNEEVFVRQITSSGTAESVDTYNEPTIPEDIIRGDIQIIKYGESNAETDDSGADIKGPLENVKFHLQSKTTGEIFTIVTDENGIASTVRLGISDRGNLIHDTYIVTEESPYPEYDPVAPFEVTVNEEGKTYYYILRNDTVDAPIQVQKIDETTGKVILAAGAQFQILDSEKNVISMTVSHYPSLIETDTFETDGSGSFTLPEKLEHGTYYLREVKAPEGYLLGGEDIQFVVDKEYQWDDPLIVRYADAPAMGQIRIIKTDAKTGDPLAGAEFTVTATEDIVTGDGTLRVAAGEVVDTITSNADGEVVLKNLFLGKYTVTETKQPTGYVLPKQSWEVELTYKDQITQVVTKEIAVVNTPTSLVIKKTEKGETEKWLEGVKFKVWCKGAVDGMQENTGEAEGAGEIDSGFTQDMIYTTDENGMIRIDYLLPNSIYCVQEIETLSGYVLDNTVYEITVDENGMIEGNAEHVLTVENERIPEEPLVVETGDDGEGFIWLVYFMASLLVFSVWVFRSWKAKRDYE